MSTTELWGALLIVAALGALGLQVHHWRQGRLSTAQTVSGIIARAGFLFLGIIYTTALVDRWDRAPLYGLALVGIGIVLHFTVNIIENHRRREE